MYYKSTEAPKFGIFCISGNTHERIRTLPMGSKIQLFFSMSESKVPTTIDSVSKDRVDVINNLTASVTEKESTVSRLFVAHVPGITALTSWLTCVANAKGHSRPWLVVDSEGKLDSSWTCRCHHHQGERSPGLSLAQR